MKNYEYYEYKININLDTYEIEETYRKANNYIIPGKIIGWSNDNNIFVCYNNIEKIEITNDIKNKMYKDLLKFIDINIKDCEKNINDILNFQKEHKVFLNILRNKKFKKINGR